MGQEITPQVLMLVKGLRQEGNLLIWGHSRGSEGRQKCLCAQWGLLSEQGSKGRIMEQSRFIEEWMEVLF